MAKDDYFVILYAILKYLYDCLKHGKQADFRIISSDAFDVPFSYWCYILETAQENGFIKGLTIAETKEGKLITNQNIQITPQGIEYLFDNGLMQKIKKTLKDIKDIIPLG